ncbi:relaxase/mobilization nuclease domain-containing protein [Micromonospora andamanensis]|uniref:MobA/VirD2-like nuclease domain-containing protein n=1 Tax=Micromonospora andamanensis TaxID=1287068 RepID=A0ABQ4I2T2_9ACTN|nr:hypothetical protein Van01_54220 [Micromonospora andamanensis]
MISRVHPRGRRVAGLLRYLYGPGRREEHRNPRLVAAWDGAGDLQSLEPRITAAGKRDFRRLVTLLEEPVRRIERPPKRYVWHTSMRLAPEDRARTFSDETWGHMAREMLREIGVATPADDEGLRWVVVRHGDDHVHIVATLVREDGRISWLRNDYPRTVAATYDVARRYGLRRAVAPADRTAHRRPSAAELNKSARRGRRETPRDELRRRVRMAVAGAATETEFFDRVRGAGLLLRLRNSTTASGQVTGYAVALPADLTADGMPVYYGGGKLAADLALPKLRRRWASPASTDVPPVGRAERTAALADAARVTRAAADEIRQTAYADPARAQAAALAASDLLTALAYTVEGDRRGNLTRVAETFDKAARDIRGRVVGHTGRSYELRAMSRLVVLMGRVSGDGDMLAALALMMDLARLADALEHLRHAQRRLHQAQAARSAAAALRELADRPGMPAGSSLTPTPATGPSMATPRRTDLSR